MEGVGNQRGSVIVFATLMIVLLLIMVGLGLDTGQLTYVRNQGQAAVDAAALAAVSALPSRDDAQVKSRAAAFNPTKDKVANDYVESGTNRIGGSNVSYIQYDFSTNSITNYNASIFTANGVRVAIEQAANNSAITTPVFLTPLLNLLGLSASATQDINVSAASVILSKPSIPIALWDGTICPMTDGVIASDVKIQLQHPDPQDGVENACWTTFLDCSSGAPDIKAGFEVAGTCVGTSIAGEIDLGTYICQNRGQVNSVLQAAEKFFTSQPGYPNRWWLVPVIEGTKNCAANNPTKIVSWAKVKPKDFVTTGNPKYILADVVCGKNLREDIEASLCYSQRLVREPAKGY